MEREHLIIIALILVALYMMNKSSSTDKVKTIAPLGRIRYEGELLPTGPSPLGYIRTREGYDLPGEMPEHIRLGDKYFGGSQHIKNHIRSRNTMNMFEGMMGSKKEGFCVGGDCGPSEDIRGLYV